jgi:hypothetical protein
MKILRLVSFLCFITFISCADGIVSECPEEQTVKVRATFSSIQSEVLTKNCATAGCHTGNEPVAGLDLSQGVAYSNIVNKEAPFGSGIYIKPGNSAESYLYQRISSTNPGSVMPAAGRLPQNVIDSVRVWIENGALNN